MANQEIDSLSLEISIKGLNERDVKNLESLADSIAKLQRNLKKLELNKLQEIEIPQKLKGLTGITYPSMPKAEKPQNLDKVYNLSRMKKDFEELNKVSTDFASSFRMGTTQKTMELPLEKGFDSLIDKTNLINQLEVQVPVKEGDLPKINTDVKDITINTKKASKELGKVSNSIKKPRKQLNAIEKELKRIKTIGLIKLIRGAMQGIIKGMGESYKNLALFDSQFNETLSTLKTAKTQAFNSIALITAPLISVVAPIVQGISSNLVNMANNISKITASLKGATTYTKVNADYMEDYAKSMEKAQSFSFDTFNTLDYQDNNMFETAELTEAVDESNDLFSIFSDLKDTFEDIKSFVGDVVKLIGGFLKDNIGNFKEIVAQSKEFTSVIFNVFKSTDFSKLLSTISDKVLPNIIKLVGSILKLVEKIMVAIQPITNIVTEELTPVILEMLTFGLTPIADIITMLTPIIEAIINGIVSILYPILQKIKPILEPLLSIVSRIWEGLSFILSSVLGKYPDMLNKIFGYIQPIVAIVEQMFHFVSYIYEAFDALLHLDWKRFGESLKSAAQAIGMAILKLFAGIIDGIINAVISVINLIIANPVIQTIVGWTGNEWNGITWRSTLAENLPSFANGGIVGELWQMNEYGNPEMLYNANGNSTAVITQEQLARAFENAIFNTGLLDAITDSKNIYIDGKNIAQSKNFKSELNRTNPSLNIR